MWCVKDFMSESTAASLASSLYLKNKKTSNKPVSMLSSWKQVLNYLVETLATNGVIAKTKMEMQNFKVS